jgi:hypothetical protein
MIAFSKRPLPVSALKAPDKRATSEKSKAERHRKADTDGTRQRANQTAEDNRLL